MSEKGSAHLPCHVLPVARNSRFFGRESLLADIDNYLKPESSSGGLRSMAIHGLGGVGKTQIALEYAYSKHLELDAVLWVPADNILALLQGFTRIAVEGLKLPNANPASPQENMLMVVSWLQETCKLPPLPLLHAASWLLIFDNVESHKVLEKCWPAVDRGAILITTRRHMVASQPIDRGLPILQFYNYEGAQLILHLVRHRQNTADEEAASKELSSLLSGYALAISQMTAYINARTMPIRSFVSLYKKYPQRLHKERKEGWKYIGYDHALDTVWDISFGALGPSANALLRVLSFCAPDSIPTDFLEPGEAAQLPSTIEFCLDELDRWDAVEQLTDHALVRHDVGSNTLSLHRLVQAECLFRSSAAENQDAFDGAVKLLKEKFPSRGSLVMSDSEWEDGARYLEQIASVTRQWRDSQGKKDALSPTVEFCNLTADCAWFVHDNDAAGIMSFVIETGEQAYRKLPDDLKAPLLEADILLLLCIRDLRTDGNFKSAEAQGLKSLDIRLGLDKPQELEKTNCYNYIAIALDSCGRHDEAKTWLRRSRDVLETKDDELHTRLLCQNNLNFSRNLFSVGDFDEAERMLDQAYSQATKFKSWYSLAFAQHTKAALYIRWQGYDLAAREVTLARSTLTKSGGFASISWVSGIVSYRASSVAIKQKEQDAAIDEAKKAVAIARLYNMPAGARARFSHLLMKAYQMGPGNYEKEAKEARDEAQRLRKMIPPGRTDLDDESDEAFEMLVDISVR
ncbi:P-loop containing nucleoside triphosphate hydrolase protein [Stachybotrys elegans]|uniref:P-loop containing nucleoside triphosphate hydrolase protein n=1 Tax=Stachybotrys elegans TaxID=80388 RepID=A0A8K0SQ17_9HYPO|nr:P-loop containing nucleoside triphosphate hydrolase protein [Stachybotrys elegans]